MNYTSHYSKLTSRAIGRIVEGYTENHHIIPKCMGGSDTGSNLVSLTPEEHFLAHQLLIKIYPNEPKLVYAVNMMTVSPNGERVGNKFFGWLRRRFSASVTGENSPCKKYYANMSDTERAEDSLTRSRRFKGKSKPWQVGDKNVSKRPEVKEKIRQFHLSNSPVRGTTSPEQSLRMKTNNPMRDPATKAKQINTRTGLKRGKYTKHTEYVLVNKECSVCGRQISVSNLKRHQDVCRQRYMGLK